MASVITLGRPSNGPNAHHEGDHEPTVRGVSFFQEVRLPEPPPTPVPPPVVRVPEWAHPPDGVAPGLSDQRLIMFHTDTAAMTIDRFEVYPTGTVFTATVALRQPRTEFRPAMPWQLEGPRQHSDPDEIFRLGVLFSDGARWTNLDALNANNSDRGDEPPTIVVSGQSGSNGPVGFESKFWLWPLPPSGALTFVVEWPAYGIEESSASVDVDALRSCVDRSLRFWPSSTA